MQKGQKFYRLLDCGLCHLSEILAVLLVKGQDR